MTAAAPHPLVPFPYRVHERRRETADTFTLELEPTGEAMDFTAGQFNMLYAFGVGEAPVSISSDPLRRGNLLHTIRAVGAVTRALGQLGPGDALGVRGPFGTGWPMDRLAGRDVVIVAGGIGLAPLRGAIYQIVSQRQRYGNAVLLYGTRTPADILFRKELRQWESGSDLSVLVTVDRAIGAWKGSVGVVTRLIPHAPFSPRNAAALICGPEVMMRFTAAELQRRGIAAGSIFVSMERNMKCAVGFCGHCQLGPEFICKDGPVFRWDRIGPKLAVREL